MLPGIINKTKAFFAGRNGPPLLQTYYDLWKLLHKGAVYSRTTSWVFRLGPMISLSAALLAVTIIPLGGLPSPVHFSGDLILLAYLLGVMRFFTVAAALDTGSSFEGMGASREVTFSALAEPALLLSLAALARQTENLSLSNIYLALTPEALISAGPAILLVAGALMIVFLAENASIPVDDPNTHLELTMIHEVMVLDHGGVDLAFITYGASLKLWILGSLLVGLVAPIRGGWFALDVVCSLAAMGLLAVITGVVESFMARLRLLRVPQLLVGAGVLSALALVWVLR